MLWATLLRKRAGKLRNKFDQSRLEANRELVALLAELVEKRPTERFGQILRNCGFVREIRPINPEAGIPWQNEFYSEPQKILERVKRITYGIEDTERLASDSEKKS